VPTPLLTSRVRRMTHSTTRPLQNRFLSAVFTVVIMYICTPWIKSVHSCPLC
jgi:hypothetical protein